MLSRIIQDRVPFSTIFGMRMNFTIAIREMTYDYHVKQTKLMCEIKSNEMIARNPNLISFLNRNTTHLLIAKYSRIPYC